MATYYEILGISPTDDIAAIKSAYRKKMRQLHPDVASGDHTDEISLVMSAYETLISEEKVTYDKTIRKPYVVPNDSSIIRPAERNVSTRQVKFVDEEAVKSRSRKSIFSPTKFIGVVVWLILCVVVPLFSLFNIPNGEKGWLITLMVLSVFAFSLKMVYHPWASIMYVIFAIGLPVDSLTGNHIFPAMFDVLPDYTLWSIVFGIAFVFVWRFYSSIRRFLLV